MINPALGTAPRPDVTGKGRYAYKLTLGITQGLSIPGTVDPWNGVGIAWDFPTSKHLVDGFEVYAGNTPGFHDPIDPSKQPGPDNDKQWGLAVVNAADAFTTSITGFIGEAGYEFVPGQQVYARVRAFTATGKGEFSEPLSICLQPLPRELAYPADAVFPWDKETGSYTPSVPMYPMVLEIVVGDPAYNFGVMDFKFTFKDIGTYDLVIDWGDGETTPVTTFVEIVGHTYTVAGTYTVTVSGSTTGFFHFAVNSYSEQIKNILAIGTLGFPSYSAPGFFGTVDGMFVTARMLETVVFGPGTTDVLDVVSMFDTADILTSVDTSAHSFNIRGDSKRFLAAAASLTTFDTSGLSFTGGEVSIREFLSACSALADFDATLFNNIKPTSVNSFVNGCAALVQIDVSGWDTSALTNLYGFAWAAVLQSELALDTWNIGQLTDASNALADVTLSTSRYDAILIAWAGQPHQSGVPAGFGNSTYTAAAQAARDQLVADGWTITDGGLAP